MLPYEGQGALVKTDNQAWWLHREDTRGKCVLNSLLPVGLPACWGPHSLNPTRSRRTGACCPLPYVSLQGQGELEMGGKHLEKQTRDKFCVFKMEFGHVDTMGRQRGFGNSFV